MSSILVIGATGRVGRKVAGALAGRDGIRALARRPEEAGLPAGIEVVRGDLTVPESLDAALRDVDHVFLVWTAPQEAIEPALERILRDRRRVVFLSAALKTRHPFFQQPNRHREMMAKIERLIEGSGCEWTHLRPGMFSANALHFWGPQIRTGDLVRWPYLEAPTAPIDERDIAEIAVKALTEDGHAGAEYMITGPESLTQREQIEIIGRVLGRQLRIEEGHVEGLPQMLLDAWAAALGQPAYISTEFQELTGRPSRTFQGWAEENFQS